MAKRVQVALTESIASLGKEGDLVEVTPGYARNFLHIQELLLSLIHISEPTRPR